MKPLTANQTEVLATLKPYAGRGPVHVATSEYSNVNGGPGTPYPETWRPVTRAEASALRGLVARGLITAEFYWRGANVTVL